MTGFRFPFPAAPSDDGITTTIARAGNPLLAQAVATPMARRSAGELNCEGKMFWDQVHPTTVVHAALSERAAAFIEQEYEFLPR